MPDPSAAHSAPPAGCLSVLVPCYNEAATVKETLRRVLASPYVGEVVVVDDASRDGSPDIVRELRDPRIRLLVQPRNMGKGAALRRAIVEARMPYVIVQDADLEYDPSDYGALLQPAVDGRADVVYGSRYHNSRPHKVLGYWHSLANRAMTQASNMVTNLDLTDLHTCYKLFRREVIQSLVIEEDRFGCDPEMTAKVAGKWRIFEVSASYNYRTYAEGKKIGWKDGVRAMYCVARYGLAQKAQLARGEHAGDRDAHTAPRTRLDGENYAGWIASLMEPYLGAEILEVGAGTGALTEHLAQHGHVVALESAPSSAAELRARFEGRGEIEIVSGSLDEAIGDRRFDAVVAAEALDEAHDDVAMLAALRARVVPGGHLLVHVPARPPLADADRGGHLRGALIADAYRAGLEVLDARFVDTGAPVAPSGGLAAALYDKSVVPLLRRLEANAKTRWGRALLLVARRPLEEPATAAKSGVTSTRV